MERKLRIGLRLIGFFLGLFLLSWSCFPTLFPETVQVAGNFCRSFISAVNNPLFTFVVVNSIIVAVYVSSGQRQTHKQTTGHDIYHEYVSSRRSIPTSTFSTVVTATKETMVDKQIVLVENATVFSPVKEQCTIVDTVTETKRTFSPVKQQPTTIHTVPETKPAAVPSTDHQFKQKEYRRTGSMVSESRNQPRPPREFRGSDTAMISRELVISGRTEPPRKSMDEMSSKEFQLIIDSFIAEKKKTLMQEDTAHYTRTKENCMPIVVKN